MHDQLMSDVLFVTIKVQTIWNFSDVLNLVLSTIDRK